MTKSEDCVIGKGWRGVLTIVGCFLVIFSIGSSYTFGNMTTYMTSYMRSNSQPNITYTDFVVVHSSFGIVQGIVFPISGFVANAIGAKVAIVIGSLIFCLGIASTYFSITSTLAWVVVTYGCIQSVGQDLAIIPTIMFGVRWYPKRKGLVIGLILCGFGVGSLFFSVIQTFILNPDNVSIDKSEYFTDPDLLSRVPWVFPILGGIYLCFMTTGWLMIREAPTVGSALEAENSNEDHLTVLEAIKTKAFVILMITRFCSLYVINCFIGFHKVFGQTFIKNDHFLTIVGSVSGIFNCLGRPTFGWLLDTTNYKLAMMSKMLLLAILTSTLATTASQGEIMYSIWVWAIFFTFPALFVLQPAIICQAFGSTHGGTIYGLLFVVDIANNLLIANVAKPLQLYFGWQGMFFSMAGSALIGALVTAFFPKQPRPEMFRSHGKQDDDLESHLQESESLSN